MICHRSFTDWINHFLDCMGIIITDLLGVLSELFCVRVVSSLVGNVAFVVWFAQCSTMPNARNTSRSCFGCCKKSKPLTAVDEPSKGLIIDGETVKKTGISDDFWSTSTYDLDNGALQSQRSLSSISFSNQSLTGSTSNNSEFVNHGYLRWKQTRLQWTETKGLENKAKKKDPVLSWNATYESLLGTNKRFYKPIPLSEMVEFLVEIWEQEGLYD